MRPWTSSLKWLAALSCLIGCNSAPWDQDQPPRYSGDAGAACSTGFTECGRVCCPAGLLCSEGACKYPYASAHLFVYLCPSFNMGCSASYFALGQACTPLHSPVPGTCYDTGFEVAASSTYAFAGCTGCGTGCGSPVGLKTPSGFVTSKYMPGITWFCGTPCEAPSDCGGRSGTAGARCDTYDCWLKALRMREGGEELPLVIVKQPTAPSSTANSAPTQSPSLLTINGVTVASSLVLQWQLAVSANLELSYEFSDPSGCSPALCLSLPRCPQSVRCTVATTTVCSRAKRDGARTGAVIRSLGFNAEPADSTATTELPLTLQLVAGPMDPATGSCRDPIDESDPNAAQFAPDALASAPIDARLTIVPTKTTTPTGGGGAGGSSQMDCNCHCENGTVCTTHSNCGIDENGIPNVCGCPVGPPCQRE